MPQTLREKYLRITFIQLDPGVQFYKALPKLYNFSCECWMTEQYFAFLILSSIYMTDI